MRENDSPFGDDFLQKTEEALSEVFGFESFRKGQAEVLESLAQGDDVVVIMPTGSGKSLCYQVPAIAGSGVTIVVSPLIALMKDQVDNLSLRGVPVTCINSSVPLEEQWDRLDALKNGVYKLVYVAPERFRNSAFKRALNQVDVSLLAIDEAHCISQWGHDFRPDYRRLKQVRAEFQGVPVIALTATATPQVREDIIAELAMEDPKVILTGFDRPNLTYSVKRVRGDAQKRDFLAEFISKQLDSQDEDSDSLPSGLVYVGTRKHAEEVADFLSSVIPSPNSQPSVKAYHAGLENFERREVQEDFMSGKLPWVVATNAFGMGVDKADIRYVIHYDLPGSVEAYYQEVGRAGRDDLPSECLLLFSSSDRYLQEFFIDGSNPSRETIESVYSFLWQQDQNPLFLSLSGLHDEFKVSGLPSADRSSQMSFRSAVVLCEHAGALERLNHSENLAEIRPQNENKWGMNPYRNAPVKKIIWEALRVVFEQNDREPARFQLEAWAGSLQLQVDSLKRALAQLVQEGWIDYLPPFRGKAIRLPAKFQSLEAHGLDFKLLLKRRQREEERLENMLRFARTWECRRNLVLRHFGESDPQDSCGRCDVCQAPKKSEVDHRAVRDLTDEELLVVKKVLSGVARARGRCGRGRVIGMLLGSKAKSVLEHGFDRLSTYGILNHFKRDTLKELLDQLELAGCVQNTSDRFPTVHLTELGLDVMKGNEKVAIAFPPFAMGGSNLMSAYDEGIDDGEYDEELFRKLRTLRRDIASEQNVPAYRVFNDRTLKAMARFKPKNEIALLGVPGVGKRTLKLFGHDFLQEIMNYEN